MKQIEQNPFRMLGIPVNATARDLAANKGKMRLLDIGREVAFPLDLPGLLPPVVRTKETVAEAERNINLPHDKLKHAMFWFAQPTDPIGKLGYDHLLQGMTDSAIEKLKRSTSWEARLCLATLALQQGVYVAALSIVDEILEHYCDEFVHTVAGQTHNEDAETLRHEYVAMLTNEVPATNLLANNALPDKMKSELRAIAVDAPIAAIEKEIATAKAVKDDDANAQLRAGSDLMSKTISPLQQLKKIASGDPRYSRTADKLAKQVLQCSINYHNAIDNSTNEPVSATVIDNCLKLAKYAESIAVGKMAKERIGKNVEILQDKKQQLPPAGVEKESAAIMQALKLFVNQPDKIEHSVTLLNTTKPHLQSMKQKLGATDPYYLKLSSQVIGNALHNLVVEVNEAQESEVIDLGGTKYRISSDKTKEACWAAWNCTKMMDSFDMDDSTRSHFNTNKRTLRNMCSQLGISTHTSSTWTPKTTPTPRLTPTPGGGGNGGNGGGKGGDGPDGCLITTFLIGLIGGAIAAIAAENFWVFVVINAVIWLAYFKNS